MNSKLTQLKQFRARLYHSLRRRPDSTMDLLDALCSDTTARSVVELSLSPAFRRRHTSVHEAIGALLKTEHTSDFDQPRRSLEEKLRRAVAPELPVPTARPFWLMALDGLSVARPHARTLTDRSFVYHAEAVRSKVPVTIGHAYSLLVALPEKGTNDPPWVLPLSGRRVPSARTASDVGVEQCWDVLDDERLPWAGQLVALVVDSGYGNAPFLADVAGEENLVTIARLRGSRVLYRRPPPRRPGQRGRPRRYGARFDLHDGRTWGTCDDEATLERTTRRGRRLVVRLRAWRNLLMRGRQGYPMHEHPLTLVRIECRDAAGKPVFRQAMWLVVLGARRDQVSLEQVYDGYGQRFDQEHAHRFLRQRLLLDAYQTPDTQHEENWVELVLLAYAQLFAARELAQQLPRPWERVTKREGMASPTMVQRDFGRIMQEIGTPARPPKRRGKSPGRQLGALPRRRTRHAVLYKSQKHAPRARAPAA